MPKNTELMPDVRTDLDAIKRAAQKRDRERLASGACTQRDFFLFPAKEIKDVVVRSRSDEY